MPQAVSVKVCVKPRLPGEGLYLHGYTRCLESEDFLTGFMPLMKSLSLRAIYGVRGMKRSFSYLLSLTTKKSSCTSLASGSASSALLMPVLTASSTRSLSRGMQLLVFIAN